MTPKSQPATKSDLKKLEVSLRKEMKGLMVDSKKLRQDLQGQINQIRMDIVRLENSVDTKISEGYSRIFNLVDPLASEIRDNRDFRAITTHHISEHDLQINALNSAVFGQG